MEPTALGATNSGPTTPQPEDVNIIFINSTDCGPYPFHKDISSNDHLTGAHIVIRGWDPSCTGADVYKVQARYRIMDHQVEQALNNAGVGVFSVSHISHAGDI